MQKLDNEYRCQEVLPWFRNDVMETLDGLEFYLKTLEKFIQGSEEREVSKLKQHADQLPLDRQGGFWAWHYPRHWEEIFASQLRSSFVVTLTSLVQSQVDMVSEQVSEIAGIPKLDDRQNSRLKRQRKHLNTQACFMRPDDACWNSLYDIQKIRNKLVHANSRISKKETHLCLLISRLPGLSAPQEVIEISSEFPLYSFRKVKEFVIELYKEAFLLCQRQPGVAHLDRIGE